MTLLGLGLIAGLTFAGYRLRAHLGLGSSLADLQAAVQDLGWRGPGVFLALVTFRQFLAIPAALLLAAGGLCFGVALGTLLGAAGIIVSGLGKFGIARAVGRRWISVRPGGRLARLEARVQRLGPGMIGLSTAHPLGILAPFHWAAGLSAVRLAPFALALCLGAPVRAFAYSVFGATLVDPGTPAFWVAALGLAAVIVLPLLIPGVRARVMARDLAGTLRAGPPAERDAGLGSSPRPRIEL
jgi:uncharacterized membrane protein YdjX (TVP38/TMEM64 family)